MCCTRVPGRKIAGFLQSADGRARGRRSSEFDSADPSAEVCGLIVQIRGVQDVTLKPESKREPPKGSSQRVVSY